MLYENYACGSDRNYTGFCDKEVDAQIDRQSSEPDPEKRRQLVWESERRLARDASRPIIFYTRAATCWRPRVKGLNLVVNSVFNGWRSGQNRRHLAGAVDRPALVGSGLGVRRGRRARRRRLLQQCRCRGVTGNGDPAVRLYLLH